MFEKFLGKKVRIVQKDRFVKSGRVVGTGDKFIVLEFIDGRNVDIACDFIAEIAEVEQ